MTKPRAVRDAERIALAFDPVGMRVGCVLLQAAMGGDRFTRAFRAFATETWETGCPPTLRLLAATEDEWLRIAELCNVHEQRSTSRKGK